MKLGLNDGGWNTEYNDTIFVTISQTNFSSTMVTLDRPFYFILEFPSLHGNHVLALTPYVCMLWASVCMHLSVALLGVIAKTHDKVFVLCTNLTTLILLYDQFLNFQEIPDDKKTALQHS